MGSVHYHNIRKSYDAIEVIHGIDFRIDEGEFVVLLGPSGCGKSTLLRMTAGLEKITSGDIAINDTVVNELHPKDRNIAMVFQNYALYAHMNVYDNMSFSLQLKKTSKAEIKKRVEWAAGILGLEPYLKRYPRELSGGQRQRVAMGRAIVRDPQVFLFDEPLSNLDAKLRVQMRTEIKALQQRLQTTTVFVTHDQIEAMTMADKIVVMHDGVVEQIGSPLEVYDRPDNIFVAEFIGSPAMNLLHGSVQSGGDSSLVFKPDDLDARLPLPDRLAHEEVLRQGQRLIYGVRPEHMSLATDDTNGAGVPFEVGVVEPTGPDIQVFGTVGTVDVCAVFKERHPFRQGDKLQLRPDINHVVVFDPDSQRAL